MDQSHLKLSWEVNMLDGQNGAADAKSSIDRGKQGVGDAHVKSCTNHNPPSAEEVGQSCRRTPDCDPSI